MGTTWSLQPFAALNAGELHDILALRQQVFVLEQHCLYPDIDGLDKSADHLCAWQEDTLAGYLRCIPPTGEKPSKLGRIVVDKSQRGSGLGHELIQRGIDYNRSRWPGTPITIGAQAKLQQYYEQFGFIRISDVYDEDGIPHIDMTLE